MGRFKHLKHVVLPWIQLPYCSNNKFPLAIIPIIIFVYRSKYYSIPFHYDAMIADLLIIFDFSSQKYPASWKLGPLQKSVTL